MEAVESEAARISEASATWIDAVAAGQRRLCGIYGDVEMSLGRRLEKIDEQQEIGRRPWLGARGFG